MRTAIALITRKVGMSAIYREDGSFVPVTVLSVGKNVVLGLNSLDSVGYRSVVLCGGGVAKEKSLHKPVLGSYKKIGVVPQKVIKEFRLDGHVSPDCLSVLNEYSVTPDFVGCSVDVSAITQGKGFAGPMKRWHFRGLRASHGVSVSHRSHGSTGCRTEPGEVQKGKKMAGRMGGKLRTTQNLVIVAVDVDKGLLYVKGSVPGHSNCVVYVKDSIKKRGFNPEFFNCVKILPSVVDGLVSPGN